jgi:hypothetical protein
MTTETTLATETPVTRTYTRPNILSLLEFQGADLFAAEGAEHLSQTDQEQALEEMLENSALNYCGDAKKFLETETLFVGVCAYKRQPVDDYFRKVWPEALVEHLREAFGEEHGDEDGEDRLSDADINELHTRMKDTVEWYLTRVKIFPCDVIRTWRFDNADLLELVEQLRPWWLEKKP